LLRAEIAGGAGGAPRLANEQHPSVELGTRACCDPLVFRSFATRRARESKVGVRVDESRNGKPSGMDRDNVANGLRSDSAVDHEQIAAYALRQNGGVEMEHAPNLVLCPAT
jgi:hypothetical protein